MKLKDSFITQEIDGTQFLVSLGGEHFGGLVRSNPSAAFIVDRLREETDRAQIVDAMCRKYDAPREVIDADVGRILQILRSIGALEE